VIKALFRRLASLVPLLLGITFICFLIVHLAPGSAADLKAGLNPRASLEARARLTQLYGLDKPLAQQYVDWLGRLAKWDFGTSFVDGQKVWDKILSAMPITIGINVLALAAALLLGIPAGVYGALHRGKTFDRWMTGFSFAAFSLPSFWVALILMSFLGVWLRLLPVSGLHSVFYEEFGAFHKIADLAWHLALPLFVASLPGITMVSRFVRDSMIDALSQNYVRTARAKGLTERAVLYDHALKNALLPVVTLLGLSVPGLLGGSVIFETIFSIPGMGRLFFNSVFSRDYPVILAMLFIGAVLTLIGNWLADIGYAVVDPRIRQGMVKR